MKDIRKIVKESNMVKDTDQWDTDGNFVDKTKKDFAAMVKPVTGGSQGKVKANFKLADFDDDEPTTAQPATNDLGLDIDLALDQAELETNNDTVDIDFEDLASEILENLDRKDFSFLLEADEPKKTILQPEDEFFDKGAAVEADAPFHDSDNLVAQIKYGVFKPEWTFKKTT